MADQAKLKIKNVGLDKMKDLNTVISLNPHKSIP